ncbi:4-(cytidine 5'-diphospho)-2-C-methyl-D-erythritol kinase [Leptospira sp. 96542]|nr:4-(cytidine 5'-diphospho)-2-C-methyl-D-erythritol kinase [Leptospira sp. 96542]
MDSLAPAKINLGLSIPYKREDGYHEIRSIFIPISFGDKMLIQFFDEIADPKQSSQTDQNENEGGYPTFPNFQLVSTNHLFGYRHSLFEAVSERGDFKKNILHKTFAALSHQFPIVPKVLVQLEKHLPPEGGIGGGSTNAGWLLRSIAQKLGLPLSELIPLAKSIGADVPFFLQNKPALVSGIGEILEPIEVAGGIGILAIPNFGLSTSSMYAGLQKSLQKTHDSKVWKTLTEDVIRSLQVGDWAYLQNRLVNDFEKIAFQTQPLLAELKLRFLESGAVYASMSGSGSCLYGLFPNQNILQTGLNQLTDFFPGLEFRTFSF